MKLIQWILVPAFILIVVLYFRKLRTLLLDRLIIVSIGALGSLMVINPNLTMSAARFFGVGRGADLVFYFGLTGLSFLMLLLFSKIRELENRLTQLARSEAIAHAVTGESKTP